MRTRVSKREPGKIADWGIRKKNSRAFVDVGRRKSQMQGAVAGEYEDSACPSSRSSLALRSLVLVPHSPACARLPGCPTGEYYGSMASDAFTKLGSWHLASLQPVMTLRRRWVWVCGPGCSSNPARSAVAASGDSNAASRPGESTSACAVVVALNWGIWPVHHDGH